MSSLEPVRKLTRNDLNYYSRQSEYDDLTIDDIDVDDRGSFTCGVADEKKSNKQSKKANLISAIVDSTTQLA